MRPSSKDTSASVAPSTLILIGTRRANLLILLRICLAVYLTATFVISPCRRKELALTGIDMIGASTINEVPASDGKLITHYQT